MPWSRTAAATTRPRTTRSAGSTCPTRRSTACSQPVARRPRFPEPNASAPNGPATPPTGGRARPAAAAGPGRGPYRPGRRVPGRGARARPGQPVRAAVRLPQRRRHPPPGHDRAGPRAGRGPRRRRRRPRPAGPRRPAGRHRLVALEDADRPFLTRGLRVPDRVTAHLLGDDAPDPALAGVLCRAAARTTARPPDGSRAALGRGVGWCTCATAAGGRPRPRRRRRCGAPAARRSGSISARSPAPEADEPGHGRRAGGAAARRGPGRRAGRGLAGLAAAGAAPAQPGCRSRSCCTGRRPGTRAGARRCRCRPTRRLLGTDDRIRIWHSELGGLDRSRPAARAPRCSGPSRSPARSGPRSCPAWPGIASAAPAPLLDGARAQNAAGPGAAGPPDRARRRLGRPRAARGRDRAAAGNWPRGPGTATRC